MPSLVHIYRIQAAFGPEQVFKALRLVCDHPEQREIDPQFEFEWIDRRIALSANSSEGVDACVEHFMTQTRKMGATEDAFYPGKVEEKDGRFIRPIGVAVHDAPTFGELIGKSLVEIGLRGVKLFDSAEGTFLTLRVSGMAKQIDYQSLIQSFPVPGYIQIKDEGKIPENKLQELHK
ncbi:hypothetical protein KQI84_00450 [bacterium]|nr:hypothetical protein [bacterium]